MRIERLIVALGILAVGPGSLAGAQSMASPPGSVRGIFGGTDAPNPVRTTQQLSIWADLGGGYDENVDVSSSDTAADLAGYATTTLGALRYWRGRTTRSFEATGRIFRNDQRAGRTTATGGEANLTGSFQGRRGGLVVAGRAANDSARLFGAFGPPTPAPTVPAGDPGLNVPDVSPQQGIVQDRWYSFGGNATAFRNWTVRHRSSAQYSLVRRRPTTDTGLDSTQQLANARHDWMFRRNAGLLAVYRFERVRQEFPDTPELAPIRTQTLEGGVRWERRFSPIRTFSMSAQAGASQILASESDTFEGSYQPTGSVSAGYTLTRRWALTADATRSITVLQGVAQAPFTSDIASASLTGVLARRVTLVVAGSYSRGDAVGGGPGSFDAVGGTATLRYAFRYGGLFAGYTRYEHRLREVAPNTGAIAPRFNQSSIRAGVTLWLPLYGAF